MSYNRYLYVMNNPLKYTDPSGHFFHLAVGLLVGAAIATDNPIIDTIATIAVGVATGGAGLLSAAATGFTSGLASSNGDVGQGLKGLVFGTIGAGFAGVIGHGKHSLGNFQKLVAHGVSQGVISEIRGGSFKSGFIGGVSGHLSPAVGLQRANLGDPISRSMVAAVYGGAVSTAFGGNFRDAAVSGAMVHLFNAEGMLNKERKYYGPVEDVNLLDDLAKKQYKIGGGLDARAGDAASLSIGLLMFGGRGIRPYFATSAGQGILGVEYHWEFGVASSGNANTPGGFEGDAYSFEVDTAFLNGLGVEYGGANSVFDPNVNFIQFEIGSPTAGGGGYQKSTTHSFCLALCP